MAAASQPGATTGMKPWLRIVFAVSLAVNLAVLGLVVGTFLRFGFPGGDRPPPPTGVSVFRALPPEDRKALRDHLRDTLPPPSDRRSEAEDLARALSAEPFDPAALETVVQAQAATRIAFQEAMQQAWFDHVLAMDDAERTAYADRLVDLAEHGKDHHKGKPGDGPADRSGDGPADRP